MQKFLFSHPSLLNDEIKFIQVSSWKERLLQSNLMNNFITLTSSETGSAEWKIVPINIPDVFPVSSEIVRSFLSQISAQKFQKKRRLVFCRMHVLIHFNAKQLQLSTCLQSKKTFIHLIRLNYVKWSFIICFMSLSSSAGWQKFCNILKSSKQEQFSLNSLIVDSELFFRR